MNIVATCHMTSRDLSYAVVYEVKVEMPPVLPIPWRETACSSRRPKALITCAEFPLHFWVMLCTLVVSDMKCEVSTSSRSKVWQRE